MITNKLMSESIFNLNEIDEFMKSSNPWNEFQKQHASKGLNSVQLRDLYQRSQKTQKSQRSQKTSRCSYHRRKDIFKPLPVGKIDRTFQSGTRIVGSNEVSIWNNGS